MMRWIPLLFVVFFPHALLAEHTPGQATPARPLDEDGLVPGGTNMTLDYPGEFRVNANTKKKFFRFFKSYPNDEKTPDCIAVTLHLKTGEPPGDKLLKGFDDLMKEISINDQQDYFRDPQPFDAGNRSKVGDAFLYRMRSQGRLYGTWIDLVTKQGGAIGEVIRKYLGDDASLRLKYDSGCARGKSS